MKREIKFRAWDKRNKAFAELYTNVDCMNNLDNENAVIMQYTGLKDKNGKEIYEGDIVKYFGDYGAEGVDSSFELNIEVSYDEQLGAFEPFANLSYNIVCREDFEVIGNIYENPELLK